MAIAKLTIMDVNDAPVAREQLVTIEVDHTIDEVNQKPNTGAISYSYVGPSISYIAERLGTLEISLLLSPADTKSPHLGVLCAQLTLAI